MNKSEFIKAIGAKSGLTNKDSEAAWNAAEEVIIETLKSGDKIPLVGFGTFETKKRSARDGINPATKQKIKIAASVSPSFKPGKPFKDAVNTPKKKK